MPQTRSKRLTAIYLCYQGIQDPLTQTQVVAYLEGLSQAGYRIILLTFEPRPLSSAETQEWSQRLAAKGIIWHWRRYHKRPTLPATAFDVVVGIATVLWLGQRYSVYLVHARAHVPGLMALVLKLLTGATFLFDIRGLMAEEYVDAGIWPANGWLFRITKRVERALMRAADGYVVLTRKARAVLEQWYPREMRHKALQVIPCCVDFRQLPERNGAERGRLAPRVDKAVHDISNSRSESATCGASPTLAYVGKLGGWYLTKEMTEFVAIAMQEIPGLRWRVWTQSDPAGLWEAVIPAGVHDALEVGYAPPDVLARQLSQVQAGLSFIKPCISKLASSPTKVGEYLAAGMPVAATAGVGDTDELFTNSVAARKPVGVLIRALDAAAYRSAARELRQLLNDPEIPARCRATAEEHYHLERVGWVRYRQIYHDLLAGRLCKSVPNGPQGR